MKTETHNRIYRLDLLKFISALVIMALHYDWHIVPQGYLLVEFFFMLEGFFLAEKLGSSTRRSLLDRFLRQFLKIYFFYFLGIVAAIIAKKISIKPNQVLHNLMMFSIFGLSDDLVSGALWFFGPYFFCSLFYQLLAATTERNKFNFILFLTIVLGILSEAYFAPVKCLNFTLEKDAYITFLPFGYIRGFVAVGVGIVTNCISKKINPKQVALIFVQMLSLLSIAFIVFHQVTPNYDYLAYLIFPCMIISFFKNSIVNEVLEKMAKKTKLVLSLSLPVYVFHPAYTKIGSGGRVFMSSFFDKYHCDARIRVSEKNCKF